MKERGLLVGEEGKGNGEEGRGVGLYRRVVLCWKEEV
jgi:hypothetical protein